MAVTYRITVYTGDYAGAGTDAKVYITIYGTKGTSPRVLLDNIENNFERNKTDTFYYQSNIDLGALTRIIIQHDNSGYGPGWYLNAVSIRNQTTGLNWEFPANRWLAVDEGDGRISVTLYPKR